MITINVDLQWSTDTYSRRIEPRLSRFADEGQAMGHCVYSYVRWIEDGQCSIWTATA